MDKIVTVTYKYKGSDHIYGDLVCDITTEFDKFLLADCQKYFWYKTYLYNDIGIFSKSNNYQIAFRVPGATRGSLTLNRLNNNQFKIEDIHFNYDVCFGEFACYRLDLKQASKSFIGDILDFSNVNLLNNK